MKHNYLKLIKYNFELKRVLKKIELIENDSQDSVSNKLSQIKIIRSELEKVQQEVDTIKNEIKLESSRNVN